MSAPAAARPSRDSYRNQVLAHLDRAIDVERPGQFVPFEGAGIYYFLVAVRLAVGTCSDDQLFDLTDPPMRAGVATFAPKPAAKPPKPRPFRVIQGGHDETR